MRVALFGGSFDPPHIGHQLACLYVLETHPVDEVWIMPVFRHAFDKRSAPFAHRVAMCQRMAAALGPRVRVSTVEEQLGGPSYTLVTVQALQKQHPEHAFALVIGSDLVRERERWFNFPELAQRVPFIVLGRSGGVGTRPSPHDAAVAGTDSVSTAAVVPTDLRHAEPVELPAVSSTEVRARLAAASHTGQLPTGWVPRSVLAYIQEQRLYLGSEPPGNR